MSPGGSRARAPCPCPWPPPAALTLRPLMFRPPNPFPKLAMPELPPPAAASDVMPAIALRGERLREVLPGQGAGEGEVAMLPWFICWAI